MHYGSTVSHTESAAQYEPLKDMDTDLKVRNIFTWTVSHVWLAQELVLQKGYTYCWRSEEKQYCL
jgi:hypothetical protein